VFTLTKLAAVGNAFALLVVVGLSVLPGRAVSEPVAAAGLPDLDCIIEPSEVIDVGTAGPGLLERVLVDRSDLVERGQIIASLESSVEEATAALAAARADLTAEIELRRVSADFGKRQHVRHEELMRKRAISPHLLDEAETEAMVNELQLRKAEDDKVLAALDLERAQRSLDRRRIRSPVSGVVMERFKSPGEYVDDTPVLRIAQLDPLRVETIVPVAYMGRIQPGMRALVTEEPTKDQIHALVTRVDRIADAASGTFRVRLELPNPDYQRGSGLRCRLSFVGDALAPSPAGTAQTPAPSGSDAVAEPPIATPEPSGPAPNPAEDARIAQPDESRPSSGLSIPLLPPEPDGDDDPIRGFAHERYSNR